MDRVSATVARDSLSDLLDRVKEGERIIIEKYGTAIAVLVNPSELGDLSTESNAPGPYTVIVLDWFTPKGENAGISLHHSQKDALDTLGMFKDETGTKPSSSMQAMETDLYFSKYVKEGSYFRIEEEELSTYGFER